MKNEEKDCTDQLTECHISCEPTDKECISECIEEYHACDISEEFTPEDVEQCITDGTDYKDCVDHMVATSHLNDEVTCYIDEDQVDCDTWEYKVDEGEIISEILTLTALLNGKCTRSSTLNSTGRSSKLITIEYDVQQRDQRASQET